jgi:Mrp family chromosome partitioning ATPase
MKRVQASMKLDRRPRSGALESSYFETLAATINEHLQRGVKTLVVTSAGPGEGKSTVTAGLARALARSGRLSVVVVDTDRYRPTIHRLFDLDHRRGLGELLKELYHLDIARETPDQFGIGDWLEILQAQSRNGELLVTDGDETFRLTLHKGRLRSIEMPTRDEDMRLGRLLLRDQRITEAQCQSALALQGTSRRALGEVLLGLGYVNREDLSAVLTTQIRESLRRLLALRRPECRFTESADAWLPATSGQHAEAPEAPDPEHGAGSGLNGLMGERVLDRLADYLKRPFLTNQIPGYLQDTELGNLKVLTCGSVPYNLLEEQSFRPFTNLLERLGRVFDVVLLDSPPVAHASPAEALAGMADGTLLVVKADGYDIQIVQQAKAQLERSRAQFIGVVLNHLDVRHADPLLYYYGAYQH